MSDDAAGRPLLPDETAGPRIVAATLIVTALALVTTCARLWVRTRITRAVSSDDFIMVVAMLMAIVNQVLTIIVVNHGGGRHMQHIPPQDIPIALKLNFVTQPLLVAAITTAKFSIGMFLLRLTVDQVYRRIIIWTIVFTWAYTLFAIFTLTFQCSNLAVLWDITVKAKCLSPQLLRSFAYTNCVLCIATDLMFSILIPVPMLWKVQLSWRNKTKVLAILSMSLGLLATSASIVKLSYIPSFGKNEDWLWDSQNLAIWTTVECCVGIVAGNLPTLRQLVSHVMDIGPFTSNQRRTGYGSGSRGRFTKTIDTIGSHGKKNKAPGESDVELVTGGTTTHTRGTASAGGVVRDGESVTDANPGGTRNRSNTRSTARPVTASGLSTGSIQGIQ